MHLIGLGLFDAEVQAEVVETADQVEALRQGAQGFESQEEELALARLVVTTEAEEEDDYHEIDFHGVACAFLPWVPSGCV